MESTPLARVMVGLAALTALTIVGTAGYQYIEGMTLLDALYMTVITLSTVGYREIGEFSDTTRWFTIGLIVTGIGTVFYTVSTLAEFFIEGRLNELLGRRNVKRTIAALRDHVIVCGFGRLGRSVADQLLERGAALVVVDPNPEVGAECESRGLPWIQESALEEQVLVEAGIDRARALVAAAGSDPINVFLALTAREMNPALAIHARASSPSGERRLRLSGVDQVISPHAVAGQRIANAILRPGVVAFLDASLRLDERHVDLEEIELFENCELSKLRLGELAGRDVRVSIVAIKRDDEPLHLTPGADEVLLAGDRVIAVGDPDHLRRFELLAAAGG